MATGDHALQEARRALADVQRDPVAAASTARAVLRRAASSSEARAVAGWALGRSLHERDEVTQARRTLREAASVARGAGFAELEAHVRSSLAMALLADGRTGTALRELTRAESGLTGGGRARTVMQRGVVLFHVGRLTEALTDFDAALPVLHDVGDRIAECKILADRGVLLTMLGRLDDATGDLDAALALAEELDQDLLVAGGQHNLGFVHGRRGDVPTALAWFDRAAASYERLGSPARLTSALDADRCDVLLTAGLATEARAAAERALDATLASGNVMTAAETRVRLARALVAERDFVEAAAEAREAASSFRRSHRYAWAALADYVAIQADVLGSEDQSRPPPQLLTRARRTAVELERRGWEVEALHVRTFVGRIALALGRVEVARTELALVARAARRGTAELRVQSWHAAALLRVAEGRPTAARSALRAGLRVLDTHRATLVAHDLRAGSSSHGAELARLGLRIALADGKAPEVFAWAERGRAASLRSARVRPADDVALTDDLARWRYLANAARDATLAGQSPAALASEISHLEQAIRDRARHASDRGDAVTDDVSDVGELRDALGAATLVEFTQLDGRLFALVVHGSRVSLHDVGPTADLVAEIRHLAFAVRRLASDSTSERAAELAGAAMSHAAGVLDARLLGPCALASDGPVVVVPTGSLHDVLWGALPSLHGRAVTVAPSASFWLRNADPVRGRPIAEIGLAAGPDLPGARREVLEIAALYPQSRCLVDDDATTTAALDLLASCEVVHLAAHGTFRADSPLFSSVRLADGPLSVYELDRHRLSTRTIVLPACDAGASSVQLGDELIGAATALLGLGVHAVLAPATIVPDEAMIPLMVALHSRLRAGAHPSAALADACVEARQRGHRTDLAAAAALACIGTA